MNEEQVRAIIHDELQEFLASDRYIFHKTVQHLDGRNIQYGLTTGTKLGTSTSQKIGFFGETPVVQPPALTAADGSTVDGTYGAAEASVINNIRVRVGEIETKLQSLGLLA